MLLRAQDAGAKVVVLTIDLNSGNNRVLLNKFSRAMIVIAAFVTVPLPMIRM